MKKLLIIAILTALSVQLAFGMRAADDINARLKLAIQNNNSAEFEKLVNSVSVDVIHEFRIRDAITAGREEMVRILLDKGMSPNLKESSGFPLLWAAEGTTKPAITRLLLDRGADTAMTTQTIPGIVDRGYTALRYNLASRAPKSPDSVKNIKLLITAIPLAEQAKVREAGRAGMLSFRGAAGKKTYKDVNVLIDKQIINDLVDAQMDRVKKQIEKISKKYPAIAAQLDPNELRPQVEKEVRRLFARQGNNNPSMQTPPAPAAQPKVSPYAFTADPY